MAIARIIKGTDHTFKFVLFKDGQPLDLSDAIEIVVSVYQKKDDILASYKLSLNEVVLTIPQAGACECYINRSSIQSVPNGRLFAQIQIDLSDLNFEQSTYRMLANDFVIGDLTDAA